MYKSKITNVDTAYSQVDNNYFIDLTVEFYKSEEGKEDVLVETKKFGYPLGTEKDSILADLEKVCASMTSDEVNSAASAELDEQLTKVQDLKNELIPKEESEEEVK